jgi:propionyl-CoA synthetase
VPLPDKLKGHVPLGILVLSHGGEKLDEKLLYKELVAATRRDLGAIACFEKAVIVPRLPKTRSGKVLRRSIREMVDGKKVIVPATIEDEDALYEIYRILKKNGLIPLVDSKL